MGSSATTMIVLKCLQTEVFEHLGISNDLMNVDEQLKYLLEVTTSHAWDQLVNIWSADVLTVPANTKQALVKDMKVFAVG